MLQEETIIRRLAYIKYLYSIGLKQSKEVETIAGFSILSFHDAVEMFLLLAAEHRDFNTSRWAYLEYWDKLSPSLTNKESMKKFNQIRVNLKHKGLLPSKTDIEISRITITQFFEENTSQQFGVEFNTVTIANLITNDAVRNYVVIAQKFRNDGDVFNSLVHSKIAFLELLSTLENGKKNRYKLNGSLAMGRKISDFDYRHFIRLIDDRLSNRWFEDITITVNHLRNTLRITALGIDYKRYIYFDAITPYVNQWPSDEKNEYDWESEDDYNNKYSARTIDCDMCLDFVIDSAIKLQEFNFDFLDRFENHTTPLF